MYHTSTDARQDGIAEPGTESSRAHAVGDRANGVANAMANALAWCRVPRLPRA